MDVKSLFKSGKKTIKAFKIATAPSSDSKDESKATEGTIEAWEAAAPVQPAPTVSISVDVEEYKAEVAAPALSQTASWSVETPAVVVEEKLERPSGSSYVPPSQRRAEATKAMPTLAEATKGSLSGLKPTVSASGPVAGGAPRLKLITSAQKKVIEEEERKKEEEKKKKDEEKNARKEELRAELERTATAAHEVAEAVVIPASSDSEIKAAALDKVFAKYVGRVKSGRKLAVIAA